MLERADGHDPVDRLIETFPALEQHPPAAGAVHLVERALHVSGLVFRQGEANDVDVVLLDRPAHGGAPPAADAEQRHAGLQTQLSQRKVDLGDLRLFQGHIVALEVCAAVRLGGVEEQSVEVVRQVVVMLDVLEVRSQLLSHALSPFQSRATALPGRFLRNTARGTNGEPV